MLPDTVDRQRQQLELSSALSAALRAVKGLAAPETGQVYSQALALWRQLGSPSEFAEIPFGMARYHAYRGEIDVALELDEQLLHLSRQRGDHVGLVLGHLSSGRTLMYAGRFAESQAHLEDLLAVGDAAFHASLVRRVGFYPQGNAQACLAVVLLCLGQPDRALACSAAAVAAARQLGHVHSLVSILSFGSVPYALVGDTVTLAAWADELVAITTEQGFPAWRAIGQTHQGWVQVQNGKVAEGLGLLHEGATAFRATGADLFAPYLVSLLANACAVAGQRRESLGLLADAFEIAERTGEHWLTAELHRLKGDLLARGGDAAQAEDCFRTAIAIAVEQGARFWQLRATNSLVQLLRVSERHAEARAMLEPVLRCFDGNLRAADVVEAQALLHGLPQNA
jgi:predicted ATPase